MFLTRSIRRKTFTGFSLVFSMLVALAVSGIYQLNSYRQVIDDLEYSVDGVPRRAELVSAIGGLFQPLQLQLVRTPEALEFQRAEFAKKLDLCDAQLDDFLRRLDSLPPTESVQSTMPVTTALLQELQARVSALRPRDDSWSPAAALPAVASLQTVALEIPDYQEGMIASLQKTRSVYQALIWTNVVIIGMVGVVFIVLVTTSYSLVFGPLQRLYRGAARVAQGDFDFRVPVDTQDEMGQLATSFNKMTTRFQEIKEDLDLQVHERSRQLVRSERLAGIGFLAAGVAHEINNPLSAIVMASESVSSRTREMLADSDHPDKEVVGEYLEMIRREAFRCRQITNRLLDFARGQNSERQRHDVAQLVREVIEMVRHMSRYRDRQVEFVFEGECYANINGPEIKQVVLNLVANALDCMESGGKLQIGLVEKTDQLLLKFVDDGCGMTQEVVEHLFEPFFTQRKSGKGTGLGLSISHRIVSDHGGTIEAESEGPGHGSTFRVLIPRNAENGRQAA